MENNTHYFFTLDNAGVEFLSLHFCERLLSDSNYVIRIENLFIDAKDNTCNFRKPHYDLTQHCVGLDIAIGCLL